MYSDSDRCDSTRPPGASPICWGPSRYLQWPNQGDVLSSAWLAGWLLSMHCGLPTSKELILCRVFWKYQPISLNVVVVYCRVSTPPRGRRVIAPNGSWNITRYGHLSRGVSNLPVSVFSITREGYMYSLNYLQTDGIFHRY